MQKVKLGENSKVCIKWRVLPVDRTEENEKNLIAKFAKKYGISKKNITIDPVYIKDDGEVADLGYGSEVANNIHDPAFLYGLYKKYMAIHKIEGIDFDKITDINDQVCANINFESYEKSKKYEVRWIKWDNFMSYGPGNYFDFTGLNGLVLLKSEPANQGGKSTFCLDLFRFLLFGKVTSRENDWTLSRVFNDFLPDATEVKVEGCVRIDGVDYVIKRTVTRPAKRTGKSKVSQKVSYYRIDGDIYTELSEYSEGVENEGGTTTKNTNKIIKEAIGNERDFDLMICVDRRNLEGLISLKDTDRGRLIARWVGLLALEDMDKIARETFNKKIVPPLFMNKYNKEELRASVEELKEENEELAERIEKTKKEAEESEKKINELNETRDALLQSKRKIDENLIKADVETIKNTLEQIKSRGKIVRAEKEANEKKLEEVKDAEFNEADYKKKVKEDKDATIELNNALSEHKRLVNDIEALQKGEFCPTCGARLKGVDNSGKIKEREKEISELVEKGKNLRALLKEIEGELKELEIARSSYNEKVRLQLLIDKNDVDIENLLAKYKENNRLLKDIKENEEAIKNNNRIDTSVNVTNENIKVEKSVFERLKNSISADEAQIKANEKAIENCENICAVIEKEEVLVRHWKVYLEMVGKNGVGKMVLRDALPLINGELRRLLNDVCDFTVEVVIDDNNDVAFNHIHDGVTKSLGGCSGFEQTVASLALRSVLSKISSFSKPSFVVFDEILGGVADENYDQVKLLYDKIVLDYAFILQISHLAPISDWHNTTVIVKKENNISKIEVLEK